MKSIKYEEEKRDILSRALDFENIRARIVNIKKEQNEIKQENRPSNL